MSEQKKYAASAMRQMRQTRLRIDVFAFLEREKMALSSTDEPRPRKALSPIVVVVLFRAMPKHLCDGEERLFWQQICSWLFPVELYR